MGAGGGTSVDCEGTAHVEGTIEIVRSQQWNRGSPKRSEGRMV